MKKLLAIIALAGAAFIGAGVTTNPAAAQVGVYIGPGGYYGPAPYYAPPPRYQRRYVRAPRYYGNPYGSYNYNGCPPHYTVQDGVCKPYRGY
jgi:hypothetical protein